MKKHYSCPYCREAYEVEEGSWEEKFVDKLPTNLGKAVLVSIAGIATGGLGSLLVGGFFFGNSVVRYVNGTKITCGNCARDFSI